ncbi:MAG: hypothetical protein WCI21_09725 [Alphaproteobacteria bacterium]
MNNGNRVLVVSLIVAIVVLVGAVMFLLGRMTAPQAPVETPAAEAALTQPPPTWTPAPATPGAATLPVVFQGKWEEQLKACADTASTTWMRLSADHINYLESGGTIKTVTVYSPLDVSFTADMDGEGQHWTRTFHFVLSPDQTALTEQGDKAGAPRLRCPAA